MSTRISKFVSAAVCVSTLVAFAGCCSDSNQRETTRGPAVEPDRTVAHASQARPTADLRDWPADAVAGECYAKAYIAPKMETVQERIVTREASERLEIVAAQYEWVEEQVKVKDASTQLVEVPAEFTTEQRSVVVQPAQTGWFMGNSGNCRTIDGQIAKDVFCLVTRPPVTKTVSSQKLVKSGTTKTVEVPAEFQTVRRQRLVAAATTNRIAIPAEYDSVETTIVAAPGRWEWQRVICDTEASPVTLNAVKNALLAAGFDAGPLNGIMTEQDWTAVKAFQVANGLGIGSLSYETLDALQVSVK